MNQSKKLKLEVTYSTTDKEWRSDHSYRHIDKTVTLTPCAIFRTPCGIGEAANRYYYAAEFAAPKDAQFVHKGKLRTNINRKKNPHFNPTKYVFVNNRCQDMG